MTPAAMAEPITPATFGPIACISRKLFGLASAPTFWLMRAAMGTAETPALPIKGLMVPPDSLQSRIPSAEFYLLVWWHQRKRLEKW